MRASMLLPALLAFLGLAPAAARADKLPFNHKVEVYHSKEGVLCFALRLEQPFLAEEFEKSNYLRLEALDRHAYLIYPKETKFHQKHAEFYGRLRGPGPAKLRLSYEMVTENPDGSRRVEVRHGDVAVDVPADPAGPVGIYQEWARQQNAHFLNLLQYHPDETFFQYLLLQSRDRYGITPPELPRPAPSPPLVEGHLYDLFTGSLAIQETLQRQALRTGGKPGDLNVPLDALEPPRIQSLDYARLLEEKQAKHKVQPKVHDVSQLIPEDQYLLHFNSVRAAGELLDLSSDWGNSLLRLVRLRAQDNRLQEKLEDQLCLRRDPLTGLFADAVADEMVITGSDPFVLEGTDVSLIFHLKKPDVFLKAADNWLDEVKKKYPELIEREFNYRGHKVAARYTDDRLVSSFVVRHGDHVIFSNSHSAVRRIVDAATGKIPRLYDAPDYRYVSTVLPPAPGADSGYLFVSEACVKRLVGPQAKIAEKRRLQCFSNLVTLNNASLFYRLEQGRSPESLSQLAEGRFVDLTRVVCPHGGAYAWDTRHDTCTCSLHNRLKYLTPNAELPVLRVSREEQEEYGRYRARYQAFWQEVFDPIAVRFKVGPRVKLEVCVLPFANGSLYRDLRGWVDEKPQTLDTSRVAPSAVASLLAVRGRKNVADLLRAVPGVPEVLEADPTLTDLSWLGDRMTLHFCDGATLLEVDPLRLEAFDLPGLGRVPFTMQAFAATALLLTQLPAYVSFDVEDRDKAARLLDQLAARVVIQGGSFFGLETALDGYRLPDYRKHAQYVFTFKLHALKVRLHAALVGGQLVAATKPEILREVIDAASAPPGKDAITAHALLRLNRRGLARLKEDLDLYWAEKARLACHRNAISIYNLMKLYEVPVAEVPRLAEAKYGVRYFCPDHGTYEYDPKRDQVECSVHGNRQHSRQQPRLDRRSSFAEFIEGLDEVVAALRFQDDVLLATVEIVRRPPPGK
jgi:hypothetical protein